MYSSSLLACRGWHGVDIHPGHHQSCQNFRTFLFLSLAHVLLCLFRFDPLAVLVYFSSSGPSTRSLLLLSWMTFPLHLVEAISATPRDSWPGASRLQFELIEDGAKRLIRVYAFRVGLRLLGYSTVRTFWSKRSGSKCRARNSEV